MKPKNTLIDDFFRAAGENDEKFLEALWRLRWAATSIVPEAEAMVMEQTTPYGRVVSRDVDQAPCSVGEALRETLRANGWTEKQAAEKVAVSGTAMQSLLTEMMPLSTGTVRGVAGFLCREHTLPEETAKLLTEWLLNGLRFWELQHPPDKSGSIRIAARPKGANPNAPTRRKKRK